LAQFSIILSDSGWLGKTACLLRDQGKSRWRSDTENTFNGSFNLTISKLHIHLARRSATTDFGIFFLGVFASGRHYIRIKLFVRRYALSSENPRRITHLDYSSAFHEKHDIILWEKTSHSAERLYLVWYHPSIKAAPHWNMRENVWRRVIPLPNWICQVPAAFPARSTKHLSLASIPRFSARLLGQIIISDAAYKHRHIERCQATIELDNWPHTIGHIISGNCISVSLEFNLKFYFDQFDSHARSFSLWFRPRLGIWHFNVGRFYGYLKPSLI
jgi:hypothetical protein